MWRKKIQYQFILKQSEWRALVLGKPRWPRSKKSPGEKGVGSESRVAGIWGPNQAAWDTFFCRACIFKFKGRLSRSL